jgi:DNA recombination protein RmuC
MELMLVAAVSAVVIALAVGLVRSHARRELAEARADMARELASVQRQTFQALAADALKDNRTAFLDMAVTSMAASREAIEDALKRVDQRLQETERQRITTFSALAQKIASLELTTGTLARALRTPHVRGRWGERQLRQVVEFAGMVEHCDFQEQPALPSDNGRLRPDMIVNLPGGHRVVVDSKAPFEAYLDAQEAPDDNLRQAKLQVHARQVRDHVEKLGGKAYWGALQHSPEIVVMFLPGEDLLSAALRQDPGLLDFGLQRKVLLASPLTLIALLTAVAHTWRQEALAENYREVARLGKEFYERLAVFADRFDDIRKRLDGAVQAYNDAAGSFESRVLVTARRLRDLEVTTASELPPAQPIDTVPRVLKQMNLMGLPDGATIDPDLT